MPVLGPDNGMLTVKTGKGGAAAKAGHNLVIEVTSWRGSFDLAADPAIELTADARSLRVRSGSGGVSPLGDAEKASIARTIDDQVLRGGAIEFRSTRVEERPGGRLAVEGRLDLLGTRRPIAFELATSDDGRISGRAVVRQTSWGIKPYSALFGTLKVADDVEVLIDAQLPSA
jgi:polyisoprenoid-binding protein YceI